MKQLLRFAEAFQAGPVGQLDRLVAMAVAGAQAMQQRLVRGDIRARSHFLAGDDDAWHRLADPFVAAGPA
ncbi:hypothetical protein [Cupriavidus sp. AcVe19-1a]|uniref:hypothetical protein n=1 Tax=Cupriavidus sp. AcVe19-1a TaxID=2821359 RepID=UPI001AE1848C|nr:hypothetical protein [Cupriavidus sp. AcVe19-1a]MBP0632692.1 hypothetical protein [Cupriavidus sp. AcVe19-1a]